MKKQKPSTVQILLTGMLVLFAAAFAVTNLPDFLAGALAALICLLLRKPAPAQQPEAKGLRRPVPVRPLIPLLVTGICLLTPPLMIESGALWKYPMHRAILTRYHNAAPSALFPDFKDGVRADYRFSYLPGIMQSTGHFAVRFVTDESHLDAYIGAIEPHAQYSLSLAELGSGFSFPVSETETVTLWYDKAFFADCTDAAVYICEAGTNPNHPHSTALIFDRGSGKVQFSRLG